VLADGGVFTFGDAVFYGSFSGNPPGGNDITGIALSVEPSGQVNGYWLVGDDGGVFSCVNAPFWGSSGGSEENVSSISSFPAPGQNSAHPETIAYAWVNTQGHLSVARRPSRFSQPSGPARYDCR
jgi:hypothetical protein